MANGKVTFYKGIKKNENDEKKFINKTNADKCPAEHRPYTPDNNQQVEHISDYDPYWYR